MPKIDYKSLSLYILSSFLLMAICAYNGYPIYGGDTQSYILSGFEGHVAPERPPFYGYFIRITSLWSSLWFTVFCQSLLLSFLLIRYIRLLDPANKSVYAPLVGVSAIAGLTCVSWVSATLIPDIFTAILMLAVLLYLLDEGASKLLSSLYVLIAVIAIFMHNSHFLLIVLFAIFIFIRSLIKKQKVWMRKSVVLFASAVLFYLCMCSVYYSRGKGFVFSPSSQLFITAKFSSNGILKKYLDDNCGKKHYQICDCKDQLPSATFVFMWPDNTNPMSKINVWSDSAAEEFRQINHDIFTTPKYLKMYPQKAAFSTAQQFLDVRIEQPYAFPPDDWKLLIAKRYFDDEYNDLKTSKQNFNQLDTTPFNIIYILCFALSGIALFVLYPVAETKPIRLLYLLILVYFLINAYVSSNFSMVASRYQERIFWILPATNIILILKYVSARRKQVLTPDNPDRT